MHHLGKVALERARGFESHLLRQHSMTGKFPANWLPNRIYLERTRLEEVIRRAKWDIVDLQSKCKHKHQAVTNAPANQATRSSQAALRCVDCGKQWMEDQ